MPTCECCGAVDPMGGILCRECEQQYRKEFAAGRVPPPLKGLPRDILMEAFPPKNWARVCKLESQMAQSGSTDEEIRAAVSDCAEKWKQRAYVVDSNIKKQLEAKSTGRANIRKHRSY